MSVPFKLCYFGIFHMEEERFLLGCEDGNIDGGIAGKVLQLHSLKEVIKAPKLADGAALPKNVKLREISPVLPPTCQRQTTERRSVNGKHFSSRHFSQRYESTV